MPAVVTVRLRYVPKPLWFDPNGITVEEGDHVIVSTGRGTDIGLCVEGVSEVEEKELRAPLKPVLRVATEADFEKIDEFDKRAAEAMPRFRELVNSHGLEMKPVAIKFLIDGDRATFYFSAEDRVDFRDLVRELASEFHLRVDMRQIGVRDEARIVGGIGHCGQELCCTRMGGEFQPVSIRMAKEQDLSLNPTKISGLCGRLMCCLRYEFEAYKDFKGRAPKKNAIIDTPEGLAKVIEFDTPRERVTLRMEDGTRLSVPVAEMDEEGKVFKEGERHRPCHIGQEAFDRIMEDLKGDSALMALSDKLFSDSPDLADTTAEAGAISRNPRKRRNNSNRNNSGSSRSERTPKNEKKSETKDNRKRRRSVSVGDGTEKKATESDNTKQSGNKRRRRSSGNGNSNNNKGNASKAKPKQSGKPRPGQNSSSLPDGGGKVDQRTGTGNKRRRRRRGSGNGNSQSKPEGGAE